MQVCELFVTIAECFARTHGIPIPSRLLEIGDAEQCWGVRLNATDGEVDGVAPFSAYVSWNGFPAGIIQPDGGCIAAGALANEATFREWLSHQ